MQTTTEDIQAKIEKLPKWAQDHIRHIENRRDDAIKQKEIAVEELQRYADETTPSPFYVNEMVCVGGKSGPSVVTRYIQADNVSVEHEGVYLSISLRDDGIDLQWAANRLHSVEEVAFIPSSFQKARLIHPRNLTTVQRMMKK